jgi:hypothetical protein
VRWGSPPGNPTARYRPLESSGHHPAGLRCPAGQWDH